MFVAWDRRSGALSSGLPFRTYALNTGSADQPVGRVASVKNASVRFVLVRVAAVRFAPVRIVPRRSVPVRSAPCRSAPGSIV